MDEKTILITGATSGIGKVSATVLAQQGHTVVIHGRNKQKAADTCEEIKSKTGNQNISYLIADLTLMSETRNMAQTFKSNYGKLDILINNAGAIFDKQRAVTTEGLEKTMALNLFSPFLLTSLLLESLVKSEAARIVNVASAAHQYGKPDFADMQMEHHYEQMKAYGISKRFFIWITQQLAKNLKQEGVKNITVNALHPGGVLTNFGQQANMGTLLNIGFKLAQRFFISPEEGASTIIHLATDEEISNQSGLYFKRKKPTKASARYQTPENEQLVWDYCKTVTEPYL